MTSEERDEASAAFLHGQWASVFNSFPGHVNKQVGCEKKQRNRLNLVLLFQVTAGAYQSMMKMSKLVDALQTMANSVFYNTPIEDEAVEVFFKVFKYKMKNKCRLTAVLIGV